MGVFDRKKTNFAPKITQKYNRKKAKNQENPDRTHFIIQIAIGGSQFIPLSGFWPFQTILPKKDPRIAQKHKKHYGWCGLGGKVRPNKAQ